MSYHMTNIQPAITPNNRRAPLLPTQNTPPPPVPLPPGFTARQPVASPQVDDSPEVPNGYPKVASFVTSSDAFSIFERFDYLRARVILYKQAELLELEAELKALDAEDRADGSIALFSRKDDRGTTRSKKIQDIEKKLQEYDTLLKSYLELRERGSPRKRNILSVRNWLDGNKPLSSSDMDIIRHPNDLVGVKCAEDYGLIEDLVMKASTIMKDLVYKFTEGEDREIILTETTTTNRIARTILVFFASVYLIAPIIILQEISEAYRVWTTCIFTVCFAMTISIGTRARSVDIFTATAGYCAVLVVFVATNDGTAIPHEGKQIPAGQLIPT